MYEVEYKVEITDAERDTLFALFEKQDFIMHAPITQNDFYVMYSESPFGGFDILRYRQEGERAFFTEKVWEMVNGTKARKETEKEILMKELQKEIAKYPDAIKVQKLRHSFNGEYKHKKIHIDMDTIQFQHSENVRFFVEGEILIKDKEKVTETKEFIAEFLRYALGREIIESPGMFTMTIRKL